MLDLLLTSPLPPPHKRPQEKAYDPADAASPSLALGTLAAAARAAGYSVAVLDTAVDLFPTYTWASVCARLCAMPARVLGISAHATCTYPMALRMADYYRRWHSATIVMGGSFVTFLDKQPFADSQAVDIVVRGEGEEAIVDVMRAAVEGLFPLEDIPGITFRRNGQVVRNEDRAEMCSLDTIPLPAWDLFPLDRLRRLSASTGLPVEASRGCWGSCVFCSDRHLWRQHVRYRSPNRVLDALAQVKQLGIGVANFTDLNFAADKKCAADICRAIAKARVGVRWSADTRVDCVDRNLSRLLRQAGCFEVLLGVESASESVLRAVGKPYAKEQIESAVKTLHAEGISVEGTFIVGLPGETYETFAETLDFIARADFDRVCIYPLIPFPGSDFWRDPGRYGCIIKHTQWQKYIEPHIVCTCRGFTASQIQAMFLLGRQFALRVTREGAKLEKKRAASIREAYTFAARRKHRG